MSEVSHYNKVWTDRVITIGLPHRRWRGTNTAYRNYLRHRNSSVKGERFSTVARGEVNWLFNVTINDISVIYVTARRCAGGLKKLDLRSGSQRHRHFVGVL